MRNFGTLYRFEVRKIFRRRLTAVVLAVVTLIMIGMNIGEYVAGGKLVNTEEDALSGRIVDDTMLDEMREAAVLKTAVTDDGETVVVGVTVNDMTYKPLLDYLYMLGGNYDKAYHMTAHKLQSISERVIDTALDEQYLTDAEKAYWQNRRKHNQKALTYGKIQNGWGDSVTIIYAVSLLTLIVVSATVSGVFSDEFGQKTDALLFSSVNGRKTLLRAKLLAGITAGMIETTILLAACVGTEFAVNGFGGVHTSVRFFVGPTAMDMEIGKALVWYVGIMLVIGLLFSVMAMFLSEVCRNSIAVTAIMMFMWLLSMLNIPDSFGLLARIWSFMPVTFLGSWAFTDYHLVWFFGSRLTVIEAAPILYLCISALMIVITKISFVRCQVKGR